MLSVVGHAYFAEAGHRTEIATLSRHRENGRRLSVSMGRSRNWSVVSYLRVDIIATEITYIATSIKFCYNFSN